jgi:hypothetical protein
MGGKKAPGFQSTTSTSPYATATSTANGTTVKLNDFLTNTNSWVENNLPSLYNQLLNPSLDNATTRAKSNLFNQAFSEASNKAFENNLINPLAKRNMLRSSQATDMYNQFSKDQNDTVAQFNNQLIADNTQDTSNLINQLMNIYLLGANLGNQAVSTAQKQSNQVSNYQLNAFNSEQAANSSLWNNLTSLGNSAIGAGGYALGAYLSDKNIKENIEKVDEIDGYNIYKFNYKDGYELPQGTRAGVIAQEVKDINPDAVVDNLQNTGFMGVDYSKLPAKVQDRINEINAEV